MSDICATSPSSNNTCQMRATPSHVGNASAYHRTESLATGGADIPVCLPATGGADIPVCPPATGGADIPVCPRSPVGT
ncbi:MAG: Fumarylacetoacetate hydrolase family protein [Ktedonobacterales bacterium]|nr:MAG: Fumarylacetoacetate hydrolase family protein [Ktedonobacterales bacterium]